MTEIDPRSVHHSPGNVVQTASFGISKENTTSAIPTFVNGAFRDELENDARFKKDGQAKAVDALSALKRDFRASIIDDGLGPRDEPEENLSDSSFESAV